MSKSRKDTGGDGTGASQRHYDVGTPSPSGRPSGIPNRVRAPQIDVRVTEELIAGAVPRNSGHCMVADAVAAAHPGARHVSVDLQTIRLTDGDYRYTYLTPRAAQLALIRFDQGQEGIEPFHVKLRRGAVSLSGPGRRRRQLEKAAAGEPGAKDRAAMGREHGQGRTNPPLPRGGEAPPVGALAHPAPPRGKRRAFGLRGMAL